MTAAMAGSFHQYMRIQQADIQLLAVYAKVLSWYKSGNYNNSIDEACMKECVSAVKQLCR